MKYLRFALSNINSPYQILFALVFLFGAACNVASAEEGKALTFEKDILPIFRAKCIRCHAGVEPKGKLNLTQPSALLAGGQSGAAIRIAAAEFSLLYEKVASDEMPASGQKLTAKEKGVIRTWINEGAKGVNNATAVDRSDDIKNIELWSFKPPKRPKPPTVAAQNRVRNPIDAFILRKLESNKLTLSAEADPQTLLRRAYFDLIGLPPSPEEVTRFINDVESDNPLAYDHMVERLLASPHYGERWARHWLDVAGYAESAGVLFEDRPLQAMWRYRDYVIRAFNKDKPYDRFLQEQIAGDELTDYWTAFETLDMLPEEVVEGITATGFLRTAPDPSRPDFSTIKNAASQYYYPTLFDTLQIVCSSTMGLTVQCARCHSHKYDPIPQVDYYRMQAVFMNAYRPGEWVPQMKRVLVVASKRQKEATEKRNAEVAANVKKMQGELAALKKQFTDQLFASRLGELPVEIRDDIKAAFATAKDKRNEVQKYLVGKFQKKLRPGGKDLDAALAAIVDYQAKTKQLNDKIAAEQRRHSWFDEIRALYDLPGSTTTPVLLRGDPLTPGPNVEPGVLTTLNTEEPFQWSPPSKEARTSGRRLAFARWLTQPNHPLTARVMVNRIWMHHFGRGLVATTEDFGVSGTPPTHPELLDWLATEFVRSGWSVKHIHRLILTSSAWRQRVHSDTPNDAARKADPDNRLLWRQTMRRLEAEPLRDAFLATAGSLRNFMFGMSQGVSRAGSGEVIPSGPYRRSIYMKILRLHPETMMEAFDQPRIEVNCTQRSTSTVSTQALTLLNSEMMVKAANDFASRVLSSGADTPVRYAILAAFSRPPTDEEQTFLTEFFDEQTTRHLAGHKVEERKQAKVLAQAKQKAMADLCHMLMSANEFAYVD